MYLFREMELQLRYFIFLRHYLFRIDIRQQSSWSFSTFSTINIAFQSPLVYIDEFLINEDAAMSTCLAENGILAYSKVQSSTNIKRDETLAQRRWVCPLVCQLVSPFVRLFVLKTSAFGHSRGSKKNSEKNCLEKVDTQKIFDFFLNLS